MRCSLYRLSTTKAIGGNTPRSSKKHDMEYVRLKAEYEEVKARDLQWKNENARNPVRHERNERE